MQDWTPDDHECAVDLRRKISADLQRARREGRPIKAWILNKSADLMLWVERMGKRMMRQGGQ